MYDEVLQAVIAMASAAIGGKQILTGSMPPNNGIAMIGTSAPESIFLDIGSNERMSIVCNGKNTGQMEVIRQLDLIHHFLTKRKDFPSGDGWRIYSIETVASPRLVGREANSQWLYASSLLVKINTKGI
jgi:hypothetical protein